MISIIIPTFNKSSRLKLCLYFLSKIHVDFNIELIIVNDGSTDDTDRVIQKQINTFDNKYNIKILKTSNSGRASARNVGARNATYELLLFLDDDIIINEQTLKSHIILHSNSYKIVRGKILHLPYMKPFQDPCVLPECTSNLKKLYKNMLIDLNKSTDTHYVMFQKYCKETKFEKLIQRAVSDNNYFKWLCCSGANTSIEKTLFNNVGGFDCSFSTTWGCEDIELGYRLSQIQNIEFIYDMVYIAYHLDHYRADYLDEHKINMRYFMEKHRKEKLRYLSMYFQNSIDENELLKIGAKS